MGCVSSTDTRAHSPRHGKDYDKHRHHQSSPSPLPRHPTPPPPRDRKPTPHDPTPLPPRDPTPPPRVIQEEQRTEDDDSLWSDDFDMTPVSTPHASQDSEAFVIDLSDTGEEQHNEGDDVDSRILRFIQEEEFDQVNEDSIPPSPAVSLTSGMSMSS